MSPVRADRITSFDDAKIAALSFESGESRVVIEGRTCVRDVPSGHIIYARGNGGYALQFPRSARWLEVRATCVEDVDEATPQIVERLRGTFPTGVSVRR